MFRSRLLVNQPYTESWNLDGYEWDIYTVCGTTDTVTLMLKTMPIFVQAISVLWLRTMRWLYPATFGLISVM